MLPIPKKDPGMSIHTGAEYVYATAARRGEIVRNWVTPAPGFASAHRLVEQSLSTVAAGSAFMLSSLTAVRQIIRSSVVNPVRQRVALNGVDAVEKTLSAFSVPNGLQVVGWRESHVVRPVPLVTLRATPFAVVTQGDSRIVGAISMRLKKQPFQGRGGVLAADLLRRALEAHIGEELDPSRCITVDAFSGQVYNAPAKHVRIRRDCEDGMRTLLADWHARLAA